jgi:hypothetical protein
MKQSLCWNVANLGWVSRHDYLDDVEQSKMWPTVFRNLYARLTPYASQAALTTQWGAFLFLSTAYLYIHFINGFQALREARMELYRTFAVVPFLLMFSVAFPVACLLSLFRPTPPGKDPFHFRPPRYDGKLKHKDIDPDTVDPTDRPPGPPEPKDPFDGI